MTLASLVSSKLHPLMGDVFSDAGHDEYWLYGGRGGVKSSTVAILIVSLMMAKPEVNAVCFRRVKDTLRDSVFALIQWAVNRIGVGRLWDFPSSTLRATYRPTGQVILFRGMDEPAKTKSAALSTGYVAISWFEEADQVRSWADIHEALVSYQRGGPKFWTFITYNPPRSPWHWILGEMERRAQRDDVLAVQTSYLDVVDEHPDWLGKKFIEEADWAREHDPDYYAWMYLGKSVGHGDMVFDRATYRRVTDAEIASYDNPKCGQDFGWYPDPWAATLSEWMPATRTLVTYDESTGTKLRTADQAARLRRMLTWRDGEDEVYHRIPVMSDDADPRTIAAQRRRDIMARPAGKGGKRAASYQLLQSIDWVIDPERCPRLADEVRKKRYDTDRDGRVTGHIPDGDDHLIDATRYAMMSVARRMEA